MPFFKLFQLVPTKSNRKQKKNVRREYTVTNICSLVVKDGQSAL